MKNSQKLNLPKDIVNATKVIEFLKRTGHLDRPFGIRQDVPEDLSKLTLKSKEVIEAARSHQSLDANYNSFAMVVHGREANPDGDVGPVTAMMVEMPRCGAPDFSEADDHAMAIADGNWAGCHNVGNFHSASIRVANSPPQFLAPVFDQVKRRVVEAYAEVGLLWHFDGRIPVNTELSFVPSSDGWIGLAIVSNSSTCNSQPIWLRLLSTYKGGTTQEQQLTQWTSLIKHELGHNCGMSHTNGGVMNPSIIDGLPVSWKNDPAWPLLAARFGGKPIPIGPITSKIVIARKFSDGRYEDLMDVPVTSTGPFIPNN